jgi:hypothetical protein
MIFVDSIYLIALTITHDQWHEKTIKLREFIDKSDKVLTTLNKLKSLQ